MASSKFTNAYLLDFESVLNIPYNEGMQNMFKELESSGLHGLLGCKSALYEPELEQFFDTALIQGGDITGAISGKYFSISPFRFAGVFELPTEGLSDFSDVPKNLVYDARKLFSKSGEPVVPHGKKKLLKYEYRLLNDILAKSITVKAGSFDAVTNERFQMMTAIHFGLKVNWSRVLFGVLEEMVDRTVKKAKGYEAQISVLLNSVPALTMGEATPFPSSKILSPKTVLTYITTNQTADTRGQSDEGGRTPVAILKRASKSKKKSESTSNETVEIVSEVVGSKKRPAVEGSEPVVPKKRRTMKGKASASTANMDMASVAQDAVPLQVIEPTPAVTAALPSVPKRKSRKRKLILSEGSDDDYVEENIDVASAKAAEVNVEESIEKESHVSAEQMFTETDVGDIVFGDSTADNPEELAQWLENYISEGSEQIPESPPATSPCLETSTSSTSLSMHFDVDDIPLDDTVDIHTSLPVGRTEFVEAIDDLRAFILQRIDDSNSEILSKLHTLERGLHDTLHDQDANARKLINSVCQDARTMSDVQKIHLNDVKKVVLVQGVTAGADSLEIRKEFKELNAKINSLDGQVAAIRNEQLEFQTKIAADILSLSTQLGDIVDYIRGGDAKKGEVRSSRRPLPTPVLQSEGTGDAVRITFAYTGKYRQCKQSNSGENED
ncbi:hypothetical protein F511_34851 [Dorcoceras hygrometricum]|uniref:Dystroglycan-like n=1 Tax=Dorcoceras hygrometricum TaxID=472368 RepID=A0A2Z7CWW3_9LAMI|nr:hypothetical protein F511_34851 [Dorcoceras hygrometricum]